MPVPGPSRRRRPPPAVLRRFHGIAPAVAWQLGALTLAAALLTCAAGAQELRYSIPGTGVVTPFVLGGAGQIDFTGRVRAATSESGADSLRLRPVDRTVLIVGGVTPSLLVERQGVGPFDVDRLVLGVTRRR